MVASAGIIIIGDEILSGKTQETNSYFLTKNLSMYGVDVLEISIISDDEKQIVRKVQNFSKKCTFFKG